MAARKGQPKKSADNPANVVKPAPFQTNREELLGFYRQMLLIRRFEEKAGQLYGMGKIGGFCHLYIGQEAVVVGMKAALQTKDKVITSYRDHGHILALDVDPGAVMAELTGRAGGVSKGKGGSMHMFAPDRGFYGGHGIVGAQVPLGTGLAFAQKYRGDNGVTVTFYGDGAANQGQVYESFNIAEVWKLPVVFVVENNRYAMGTSVERSTAESELYRHGEGFRIPGKRVNGMDVLEVRAAMEDALDWCRSGKGPILLEMKTYRYRGHSMSDPAKYRTKEEVAKVRETQDPINMVAKLLQDHGWADEDALKGIDKEIKAQVAAAADFADSSAEPDSAALFSDIYAEG